jgi:hypothetical protein
MADEQPERRAQRRRNPIEQWVSDHTPLLVVVIAGCFIAAVAIAVVGGSSSGGTPVHDRVSGHMGHDSVGIATSNSSAFDALSTDSVWCGWRGSHVVIHALFTNSYGAGVKLDVSPAYSLQDAGDHGDSEDIAVEVPAGKTVGWLGDAGTPEGNPAPGTPITNCDPEINSINLG